MLHTCTYAATLCTVVHVTVSLFGVALLALQTGNVPGPVYRSIIHILSHSPGNRWKEAHSLLEEARTHRKPVTTVTYNTVRLAV
jgi:hypothetical protein